MPGLQPGSRKDPTAARTTACRNVRARVRSTRQRPGWLVTLRGWTMETTLRAPDVRLATTARVRITHRTADPESDGRCCHRRGQLIRLIGLNNGLPTAPAVALPPTACPAGTTLHSGDIATIAGTGAAGYNGDDGPAVGATLFLDYGGGLAVDPTGVIYLSDTEEPRHPAHRHGRRDHHHRRHWQPRARQGMAGRRPQRP